MTPVDITVRLNKETRGYRARRTPILVPAVVRHRTEPPQEVSIGRVDATPPSARPRS